MMKNKNEKGSILMMSAVLLSVVVIIGTMLIVVFFRGFIDVALDIRDYKDRLAVQVEAQEYLVGLDRNNLDEGIYPEGLTYDEVFKTYTYVIETEKYTVTVTTDIDLNITKWQVKE